MNFEKITNNFSKILTFFFFKSLMVLTIFFYLPKLIYLLATQKKIIAFDWNDGLYEEMYFPLIKKLEEKGVNIVYFIDYGRVNHFDRMVIRNSLPKLFAPGATGFPFTCHRERESFWNRWPRGENFENNYRFITLRL